MNDLSKIIETNPDVPQSSAQALLFAKRVYDAETRLTRGLSMETTNGLIQFDASDDPSSESCGEYSRGIVDLLLASDMLDQDDRNEINSAIADAQPSFEKDKTIDHFRFFWTETSPNPDDNVTEAQIDQTGDVLNSLFELYSNELRMPQADLVAGKHLIDVEVYFDSGLYGSTSSHGNKIFLNSRDVVRDNCRRKTTSAHELFHRVEYSYGYVTGTANQRWWVEALGSWSQKFAFPEEHDYVRRIDAGFNSPKRNLLKRSYDACHYWKYLGERLVSNSSFAREFEAIRRFMEIHDGNGNDAQAACAELCTELFATKSFDSLFAEWALVNFTKDFTGAPETYADNSIQITNCGRTFGPYPEILIDSQASITASDSTWVSPIQSVGQYGSNYHLISFATGLTNSFKLRFEGNTAGGTVEFAVGTSTSKDNNWVSSESDFTTGEKVYTFDLSTQDIDQIIVVVSAIDAANGKYIVSIDPA